MDVQLRWEDSQYTKKFGIEEFWNAAIQKKEELGRWP
jgi:hypothetical protein